MSYVTLDMYIHRYDMYIGMVPGSVIVPKKYLSRSPIHPMYMRREPPRNDENVEREK